MISNTFSLRVRLKQMNTPPPPQLSPSCRPRLKSLWGAVGQPVTVYSLGQVYDDVEVLPLLLVAEHTRVRWDVLRVESLLLKGWLGFSFVLFVYFLTRLLFWLSHTSCSLGWNTTKERAWVMCCAKATQGLPYHHLISTPTFHMLPFQRRSIVIFIWYESQCFIYLFACDSDHDCSVVILITIWSILLVLIRGSAPEKQTRDCDWTVFVLAKISLMVLVSPGNSTCQISSTESRSLNIGAREFRDASRQFEYTFPPIMTLQQLMISKGSSKEIHTYSAK